eukprot:TRINITY_DN14627_c0_g3_i1.p1 TRINITY_DN14627_c0_g3~~TRINITY_DN14627_c0_g3_i1.p1  ORF type:complete len:495 (-),score=68.76 TRINITY_DN14627_c0_g3_i1:113-1597(-)
MFGRRNGSGSVHLSSHNKESSCAVDMTPFTRAANDFKGLAALYNCASFSDIVVRLQDGTEIQGHRVIIAAASDTLRAKFLGSCRDSVEPVWSPDFGAPETWRWIFGWMYGLSERLVPEHAVEALVIADMFQIRGLANALSELLLANAFSVECVTEQLLQVSAVPEALTEIAMHFIPLAVKRRDFWDQMWNAPPQNVALAMRFVPVLCESDRLRLIGRYFQFKDSHGSGVLECFQEAINWECFPVATLEAFLQGDYKELEAIFGASLEPSDRLHATICSATLKRCRGLEHLVMTPETRQMTNEPPTAYLMPLGADRIAPFVDASPPWKGIFGHLVSHKVGVDVNVSSMDSCAPSDLHAIFELDTPDFRTSSLTPGDQPWIEISCAKVCDISPEAIGLKHGLGTAINHCESFVLEATAPGSQDWRELWTASERNSGTSRISRVIPLPQEASGNMLFDRFRIRMAGPTDNVSWCLILGWFDVFGRFQGKLPGHNSEH